MFRIFGAPPRSTPMSLQDLLNPLGPEDRQQVGTATQASVYTRAPFDIEYRVTRPDGTTSDVRSRAVGMPDAGGAVTRLVGTTLDITDSREAERLKLGVEQLARQLAEGIVDTVSEPLIVLDRGLRVVSASRSFYQHFKVAAEHTVGRSIYDLDNGQWDIPGLGPRRLVLNARRLVTAIGHTELTLLAMAALEPLEIHEDV